MRTEKGDRGGGQRRRTEEDERGGKRKRRRCQKEARWSMFLVSNLNFHLLAVAVLLWRALYALEQFLLIGL